MGREERRSYLSGYERRRSADEFVDHFPCWALVTLLGAAWFRIHVDAAPPSRVLALLQSLTERATRVVSGKELFLLDHEAPRT
jgi:hypothetical protein